MGRSVLIVGTDALARGGLRSALMGSFDRVADTSPEHVARVVRDEAPDVVLWDATDGIDGFDARVPVLALAEDAEQAAEALGAGVAGVLLREGDAARITAAVDAVAAGLVVVDDRLASAVRPARERPGGLFEDLTGREREVLHHLAEGLSNREIALELGISEHTAKFHVNAILGKMDARTRTEAVVRAARLGMLVL